MLKKLSLFSTSDWKVLDEVTLSDYSVNDIIVLARTLFDESGEGDDGGNELHVGLLRGYEVRTYEDAGRLVSCTVEKIDSEGGEMILNDRDLHFEGGRWWVKRVGSAIYDI